MSLLKFSVVPGFRICSMGKNLEMTSGNGYHCKETAKVQSICYLSTILALLTRKATFELQCLVSWFEQYFENYVLKTQNPFKGALNKVNGLITSKN